MGGDPFGRVGVDVAGDGVDRCYVMGKPANLSLLVRVSADEGLLMGGAVTDVADELDAFLEVASATPRVVRHASVT